MTPEDALGALATRRGESFIVRRHDIVEACRRMRDAGWEHLMLITAVDWRDRWEVLYHLVKHGERRIVCLRVDLHYQDPTIPSVTGVWPGAGWHERETFDLMGIVFEGNPDLRRILLPQDYEGHPLRKEVLYGNRS